MIHDDDNTVRALVMQMRAREGSGLSYDEMSEHYAYTLPENAVTFRDVAEARATVTASGSHYWDRDAVRFFRARTDTRMFGGRFWVESRQYVSPDGDADPREYLVAWVSDYDGRLSVEKLGNFSDLPAARKWAKMLADRVTECA